MMPIDLTGQELLENVNKVCIMVIVCKAKELKTHKTNDIIKDILSIIFRSFV